MTYRKMFSFVVVGIMSLVVAAKPGFAAGQETNVPYPKDKSVRAGTTGTSSGAYAYWVAMARAVQKTIPGVNFTVVESGAAVENTKRLAMGQFEIIHQTTTNSYYVWNGLSGFEKNQNIRELLPLMYGPQASFVRADSPIRSLKDLDGKDFSPGARGSTTEITWVAILNALGVKPKLYRAGYSDIVNAYQDGRIVGFAKGGVALDLPDALVLDANTRRPLRAMVTSEAEIKKVREAMPELTWVPLKVSVYTKGAPDILVPSFNITAQTTKDGISEEMAYWVVRAAFENKQEMVKTFQGGNFDWQEMIKTFPVPLHSGAVRYLEEIGMKVPAHLIPPEYKR
ncbi:MAG: hypothetical protein A3G80_06705 [Betaproteobacteria bacterium RIFCSPLOWO2_12_FULL_62_13b]|nr:MAG: hypothetical protein A3G80_06705 [Betaproteobacteria bacterium RIFCSPLOWO2_12_FULL_62_13b]